MVVIITVVIGTFITMCGRIYLGMDIVDNRCILAWVVDEKLIKPGE